MESAISVKVVQESVANPFGGKGGGRSSTASIVVGILSFLLESISTPEES